jgi:chromate transporter
MTGDRGFSPPEPSDSAAPAQEQSVPHQSLGSLFWRFLRFGFLAWGGPVAQIAMIQRELVDEQRWVTRDRFRQALAVYQVLPGPEAHELCVWLGMLARGRLGALLAGLGFMLPGLVLMLTLGWLYTNGALDVAELQPVFAGLQAAVVAVILRALVRIGGHAWHDLWLLGVGIVAALATLLGVHFAIVLAAGGLWRVAQNARRWAFAGLVGFGLVACVVHAALATDAGPVITPAVGAPPSVIDLFVSGLRAGMLTFGGAYTVIPFLQQDAVVDGGWLSNAQFLDGVALAGVLPAPLVIFATFVGHVAAGLPGALAMTAGVFLPAFAFTLLGHGLFERITGNRTLHGFLDWVTAAVVGLMVATTVDLVRAGIAGPWHAALAAVAFAVLWRWKARAAIPVVVLFGGLCGLAIR